jgi:hypothetical protein
MPRIGIEGRADQAAAYSDLTKFHGRTAPQADVGNSPGSRPNLEEADTPVQTNLGTAF